MPEEFKPITPEITPIDEKKQEYKFDAPVSFKKQSGAKSFFSQLILGDMQTITNYVVMDVLLPSIKSTILQIVSIALYGSNSAPAQQNRSSVTSISYRDYYDKKNNPTEQRRYEVFEYDEVARFASISDARFALDMLKEKIAYEGFASVADLYQICKKGTSYVSESYGWPSLEKEAKDYIIYDPADKTYPYWLKLPKPVPRPIKRY